MPKYSSRVLIVDDERSIADSTATILNQAGFHASAVYDGEAAVALVTTLRPDVLISDVMMGGMNGVDLAVQICRQLPDCRILLVSGSDRDLIDELLQRAGDDSKDFMILRKPVRPEVLLTYLAQVA